MQKLIRKHKIEKIAKMNLQIFFSLHFPQGNFKHIQIKGKRHIIIL